MGGIAALVLLTHCGGGETEEPAAKAVGPRSPSVLRQAVADCMPRTETRITDIPATYDGYASQSQPTSRFGSEPVLRVDTSPERLEAFLQFRFSLLEDWHVRQAKLRLHTLDETSNGPLLYRVSDGGTNFDFDWNTRPALLGAPLGNLGAIAANTWVEYDVSSVVTKSGIYSFGLVPEASNGVDFVSANSGQAEYELRPHLLLTVESEPFCSYRGTGGGLTGWTRHYGGLGPEKLHALGTDAQGGLVAAGLFGDAPFPNGQGFALARYTSDGTPSWTRQVTTGDVRVRALTVTPLGNILVVGNYSGAPDLGTGPLPGAFSWFNTPAALFIAKFSPTGRTQWAHGFVSTYVRPPDGEVELWPVTPMSVATDANGSLIVAGGFQGQVDFGGGPLFAGVASVDLNDPLSGGFVAKFSWEGQHLWSKAFQAGGYDLPSVVRSMATDSAGNILLGGSVNSNANLGDGPLGTFGAFIAKYDTSGALLWKRLFDRVYGEVVGVQPLGTNGVAFSANLGGDFTFGGATYRGGHPDDPSWPENLSAFSGTLNTSGADGWIRDMGFVTLEGLVTGSDGTLNIKGLGSKYDLGGGILGDNTFGPMPFVARYSASGGHLWSRSFDRDLQSDDYGFPLLLAPQPGGSVVVGADFTSPVEHDGTTYTARGSSDLIYFQLKP